MSAAILELTPGEFVARRAAGESLTLLDVREEWETRLAPAPTDVVLIPMGELPDRLSELDPDKTTVVLCRSGGRSLQVAQFLQRQGFKSPLNLAGGILAWSRELDPRIPEY